MNCSHIIWLLLTGVVLGQERPPLALTGRMELANVDGRIDHFSADVKGKRLFVSALGNRTVEVLDVDSGKRLRTLSNLAKPQGNYYDPSTNRPDRRLRPRWGDPTVRCQLLSTMKSSGDADNIRYDSRGRRVIVGYGDGALAVPVKIGEKFEAGVPQELSGVSTSGLTQVRYHYSPSPNGQRFLVNVRVDTHPQTILLQNWLSPGR